MFQRAAGAKATTTMAAVGLGMTTRSFAVSSRAMMATEETQLVKLSKDVDDEGRETGVSVITLNRPKQLNALSQAMAAEFTQVVDTVAREAKDGNGVRAVVLTGEGAGFSAGGDLEFLWDRTQDNPLHNTMVMRDFYQSFLCVRTLPVPVLAAMNGHAVGAGACLAMATDIRIASTKARIGFNFTRLGLHPGMGVTYFLPTVVGPQIAARLLLTGELVDGVEAERLGLVLQAVEPSQVLDTTLAMARDISQSGPVAVKACVRSLRMGQEDGALERALWREADSQAHSYATQDMQEGLTAIKAKRDPVFTGK